MIMVIEAVMAHALMPLVRRWELGANIVQLIIACCGDKSILEFPFIFFLEFISLARGSNQLKDRLTR